MQNIYDDRLSVRLKGLSSDVDADLLFELGIQFGNVTRVNIPINRATQQQEEFGFIQFASPADAQYMFDVISSSVAPLRLFGRTVTVTYQPGGAAGAALSADAAVGVGAGGNAMLIRSALDSRINVGANILVSGLSRKLLDMDTVRIDFSQFGPIIAPPKVIPIVHQGKVLDTCSVRIDYAGFDASEAAIAAFNDQFLYGKKVRVEYAMREDGKGRHGSDEEKRTWEENRGKTPLQITMELQEKIRQEQELERQQKLLLQQQQQQQHNSQDVPLMSEQTPQWAVGINPYQSV